MTAVGRRSPSKLAGLAATMNASKAEAIAMNMMYAEAADIDIQNLYASLFNTTLAAQTCCGWSYHSITNTAGTSTSNAGTTTTRPQPA